MNNDYAINRSFCHCDCHKDAWFSTIPPICNCKCWSVSVNPPYINTVELCQHGMPVKFGNCVKCAEDHKNNLMNSQNEHLIKHAQDGIEKCFDRIEKIEENIKDIKIYSNPLQEKVWQENIIKRFEKLEKFHDEFKNILKEDIEEYQEIHEAIENRLTKLESSKLTQELDPKVWVHIHERLDRVESKTMLMIDVEENLKQWRWVHEQIARLDLVIKAKEFGVQMEEGNRYMEVVSGLELKLLDKINDVIKMMVKEDLKNEDHNIKLELRLEKLEKLFTDDIEEIHRVLEEHRKSFIAPRLAPFKCPVCDGLGTRCIYAHIPNQTCTCVTCKGKGIVWSE